MTAIVETDQGSLAQKQSSRSTPTERYFLFVRYWPGFTKQFPYRDFDHVGDDDVDSKLRAALDVELRQQRVDERDVERAKSGPNASGFDYLPEPWRYEFMAVAELVGWTDGLYHLEESSTPGICTRRVCIGVALSVEEAEATVKEIGRHADVQSEPWKSETSNPRFSFVTGVSFNRAEIASAHLTIDRLRSGKAHDTVEEYAAKMLHVVDAFHAQWEAADSMLNPQLTAAQCDDIVEARTMQRLCVPIVARDTVVSTNGTALSGDMPVGMDLSPRIESTSDAPPDDLISWDDVAILAGVALKTLRNRRREWGVRTSDPCSYAVIRPFLTKQWKRKARRFPESFDDVKRILKNLS